MVYDAVLMNFVVIGEAVARISDEFKAISWLKIKGFRNLIAHDYFGIDAEEVWQIIESNILELDSKVQSILTK